MVSVTTVKSILRITDVDSPRDALIDLLIPITYADICEECNNTFGAADFNIESDAIYFDHTTTERICLDAGGFTAAGFPANADLIVTGSRINDGIYTLASQSDTVLTVNEEVSDETQTTPGYSVKVSLARFPKPLELIASRMIGYQLSNSNSAGLASMSLGNYSETRAASGVTRGGYPDEILNSLRPWKMHRVGRGSILWHINENRYNMPPWTIADIEGE